MAKGKAQQNRGGILSRWRKPLRVVIIDPVDLQERRSFTLSLGRIYILLSSLVLLLILGTATLTLTTPLKYYLPGYGDPGLRNELMMIQRRLDSIQHQFGAHQRFEDHLKMLLLGQTITDRDTLPLSSSILEKEARRNLLPLPLIREEALEQMQEENLPRN